MKGPFHEDVAAVQPFQDSKCDQGLKALLRKAFSITEISTNWAIKIS